MAARAVIQGLFADLVLIDVTRLIWRAWRGRRPTGIDRVCLAYIEHFRDRSLAVIQRKGLVVVLSQTHSRKLFDLLLKGSGPSKVALIGMLARAAISARRSPPREDMIYLNVGHTGLNDRSLPEWIRKYRVKALYLIHDLIPITHPEFCRPGEAEKHSARMLNALESATGVITNSRATLLELASFATGKGLERPPGVVAWIAGLNDCRQVSPKSLAMPYFVTVGTIEARKNHILLLRVWQRLVADLGVAAPALVVVGQPGWEADEALGVLEELGELEGKVIQIDGCLDEELAAWVAGARALLMPSFAEGFGLPVVEALNIGTPVIASELPVFREIAGDIPTYLSATDRAGWECEVKAFMNDSSERNRQISRLADYRCATWSKHFEIVEAWLATL